MEEDVDALCRELLQGVLDELDAEELEQELARQPQPSSPFPHDPPAR